ncbi:hypothetical protein P8452_12005 [Trifolium repens]|nr:hypothetical protein P8452_12005 [Trifolium repens]
MSMECDTSCLFGVIRPPPPPENLDERGKQPKSEPEEKQKRRQKAAWELKAVKDLTPSDFSMYDDAVKPFRFACPQFVYNNKAMIEKEKEVKAACADYMKRSRNLSPFDAITPPKIKPEFGGCSGPVPVKMTNDLRLKLIPLCKAALDKYNAENQDAKFVFLDVVKTAWRPGGIYYITFQAQIDYPNCSANTFQAMVMKVGRGPTEVKSCDIKI